MTSVAGSYHGNNTCLRAGIQVTVQPPKVGTSVNGGILVHFHTNKWGYPKSYYPYQITSINEKFYRTKVFDGSTLMFGEKLWMLDP